MCGPNLFDVVLSLRAALGGAPIPAPVFDPGGETDRSRVAAVRVVFADGRAAASYNWPAVPVPYRTGAPVLAVLDTYGQGEGTLDVRLHIWPLPPAGPLVFVVDWPAGKLTAARVEVDAGPILAARQRVVSLSGAGDHDV